MKLRHRSREIWTSSKIHLEDIESLSLPLQESVEKTKIRWNIRFLGYVFCLNTPMIKINY